MEACLITCQCFGEVGSVRYEYRCAKGHDFEKSFMMDDFLPDSPINPRVTDCPVEVEWPFGYGPCGVAAKKKFSNFTFSMPSEGGFNSAAGAYHANDFARLEWMKRSERLETNPFTGAQEVVRPEPIYPEQVAAEKSYLKDVKEAALDRAPPPVHPAEKRKEKNITEALRHRVKERIASNPREFGALLNNTPEYPAEVLEKRQTPTPSVGVV